MHTTISKRLILATTAAILAMLAVFAVYVVNNLRTARDESRTYVESLQESLTASLAGKALAIKNSTTAIAQISYVEEYFTSDSVYRRRQISRFVTDYAQYVIETNPDVIGISLFSLDALPLTVGSNLDSVVLRTIVQSNPDVFDEETFAPFEPFFTQLLRTTQRDGDYYAYIMPVYAINDPVPMTRIATCITLCDARSLNGLISQTMPPMISDIRLFGPRNGLMARRLPAGAVPPAGTSAFQTTIPSADWRLEIDVDWNSSQINQLSIGTILLLVLVCCVLLITTAVLLHYNLVRPVQGLIGHLGNLSDYTTLSLRFGNELDVIVDTINGMLGRLDESAQARLANETKMYELQLHAKQTALSALQSQINPHFLYNTLECMRSIGLFYEAPEIVDIANAMSAIFRYSIKGAAYVRLGEELEIVKQYFTIIDVRFDGRFSLEIDFPEDTLDCVIPKMILQPLVENAIYHGLEPQRGAGRLKLTGRARKQMLYLTVEDNGRGMAEIELSALHRRLSEDFDLTQNGEATRSIGLANINQRIRFMAPSGGLSVDSRQNEGTTVCLHLPLTQRPPLSDSGEPEGLPSET